VNEDGAASAFHDTPAKRIIEPAGTFVLIAFPAPYIFFAAGAHAAASRIAHAPGMLGRGDFARHAAEARDNGMMREEFLERLVAVVGLMRSAPKPHAGSSRTPTTAPFCTRNFRVFDVRQLPTRIGPSSSRSFDRSAR
jgi:hypothetical protein